MSRFENESIRDDLTAEWKRSGIETSREFAALTNILTKSWSGKTVQEYKKHKNLHKENLRDNMTNLELTLNQLAEVSATAISKVKNPNGMEESKKVAIDGGTIARNARLDLERQLGQSVISSLNASDTLLSPVPHCNELLHRGADDCLQCPVWCRGVVKSGSGCRRSVPRKSPPLHG